MGNVDLADTRLVAKKVLFRGDVQGVGFRFTAVRIAQRFEVTGYVKNLAGGEVELVAEGDSREVATFVEAVHSAMAGHVSDDEMHDVPAAGRYDRFGVSY